MRRQLQPRWNGALLETGMAAHDAAVSGARTAVRNPTHLFGINPAFFFDATTGSAVPVSSATITYSGGTNGTRVNSAGVIVAATTPRIDYDPVTLAVRGLLVEQQRTNLLLNSTIDGANLATQSVTLPASAHTLTFYGTGTITLSGAFVGSLVGSGAYPTRSTLTFTPSAGSVTFTVTGTVQYAQLEAGAFPTSYIPTAGSAVTRTADFPRVEGAAFSSFFLQSEGTWFAEIRTRGAGANPGVNERIIGYSDGVATPISFVTVFVGFPTVASTWNNSVEIVTANSASANAVAKVACSYNAAGRSICLNAGTVASGVGAFPVTTNAGIGTSGLNGDIFNGHVRRVLYWNTRLPNATLQALTA